MTAGSRASSKERRDSEKHTKGVRNYEEYKKSRNGPPVSELMITAEFNEKDGVTIGSGKVSTRDAKTKTTKDAPE